MTSATEIETKDPAPEVEATTKRRRHTRKPDSHRDSEDVDTCDPTALA